jgi:hypothetical protein
MSSTREHQEPVEAFRSLDEQIVQAESLVIDAKTQFDKAFKALQDLQGRKRRLAVTGLSNRRSTGLSSVQHFVMSVEDIPEFSQDS